MDTPQPMHPGSGGAMTPPPHARPSAQGGGEAPPRVREYTYHPMGGGKINNPTMHDLGRSGGVGGVHSRRKPGVPVKPHTSAGHGCHHPTHPGVVGMLNPPTHAIWHRGGYDTPPFQTSGGSTVYPTNPGGYWTPPPLHTSPRSQWMWGGGGQPQYQGG